MSDAERYGNTRIGKIRAAYNDLRSAIRAGDMDAADAALDRYEQWADFAFAPTPSPDALIRAALDAAASKAYRTCAETRHVTLGHKCDDAIRALADDPEALAAIRKAAEGRG